MRPLLIQVPITFGFVTVPIPAEIDEGSVREDVRQDILDAMRTQALDKAVEMGALLTEGPPVRVCPDPKDYRDYAQYIYPAVKLW